MKTSALRGRAQKLISRLIALNVICSAALLLTSCAEQILTEARVQGRAIYGVDLANNLIRFGSQRPDSITSKPISGLQIGEMILGIDFRPIDGRLYAVSSFNLLYVIDTPSGAALQVGPSALRTILNGTNFGFGFNPVPDKIRIHSNTEQDLRVDPVTVALATDSALAYDSGDANFNINPNIVGTAYTNSLPGATSTTLYAIDSNFDILVMLPVPNNGRMRTIGALGVNTTDFVGFDIDGRDGTAYASLTTTPLGTSNLYTINFQTGAATFLGNIGNGTVLHSIALAPPK